MGQPIVGFSEAALAQAAALLQNQDVCAFPTETVYGLGANALSTPRRSIASCPRGGPPVTR